jgi:hypothetical protein
MKFKDYIIESVTDIENFLQDNLSSSKKPIEKNKAWMLVKSLLGNVKEYEFEDAWDNLMDAGHLKKAGPDKFKWKK